MALEIFRTDPTLESHRGQIWDRVNGYRWWKNKLAESEGGMEKFAEGYKIFGFHRQQGGWRFCEWLPNAKQVFLVGEFNSWENTVPLTAEAFGRWAVFLEDRADGTAQVQHRCKVKLRIEALDGSWIERVPAWTKLALQDHTTNLFNGLLWDPPKEDQYEFKHPRPMRPSGLKIYEAHVGMASKDPKVATYLEFAETVLPRIKRMGYNAVQLMAVAEHAHYGCFGYHVTSFFAPASRSGSPEDLKKMVDTAHGLGIIVLMDLVHAHASSNTMDGIAQMDGTDHCYTHGGAKGHHTEWDSKIFHYTKHEVLRFLLSNVKWWIEEYGFDGFRFDGITSMLYKSHGIGKGYTGGYHEYFGPDADIESHIYLMLANDLIHSLLPSAVTIGEDVSGMPTLCRPVHEGGFGFDYRLAMAIPDMFIKLLKESSDDGWGMGHITHTLTNRRWKEKVIAYCESHDQAIVGDKTLAFWLMDAEMYTGMSLVTSPQPSITVDRGLALHKMIRMLVLGLGGEGYLNFIGNEFGHPEWIDFPRPENEWSHGMCRRRWDLPEDDNLRYKFFEAFDELMQACECRFQWMESSHQYVTLKDEGDKVIVFERGDLMFAFNFHPCNSYQDYQVGVSWSDPMRCVLDSDEARFGGQCRLEHGHTSPTVALGGINGRPHSVKMYMPSRTLQVFAKEKALGGGVRVHLDPGFLRSLGVASGAKLTLTLDVTSEDGKRETSRRRFTDEGVVVVDAFDATFGLETAAGEQIKCAASKDDSFRAYFPGNYTICGSGFLSVGTPQEIEDERCKQEKQAVADAELNTIVPPVDAKESPQEQVDMSATAVDMTRCCSGLHFVSNEVLDALDAADADLKVPVSMAEWVGQRATTLAESVESLAVDGGLDGLSRGYQSFGLHQAASGEWTFKEWIPNASAVFLVGDFNSWSQDASPLSKADGDVWSASLSASASRGLSKGSKYKLFVHPAVGNSYWAVPAWSPRYTLTEETGLFDAVVCPIDPKKRPKKVAASPPGAKPAHKKIYECHLGLVDVAGGANATFASCAKELLPRIARKGYSDVLLVGALECKEPASMGKQPLNLFALASKFGMPDDFADFVSEAHRLELRVLLSIAHNGVASCEDGLGAQWFPSGELGVNFATGARLFDFSSREVQRYLLSCLRFWLEEYGVDGFRLQGVSEMIYTDRGLWIPEDASERDRFLMSKGKVDGPGIQYLMMANQLVHEVSPGAVTIAEEFTSFPLLCEEVSKGGIGFDMRQVSELPSTARRLLKTKRDEEWGVTELYDACMKPRSLGNPAERDCVLGSVEALENCVVGRRPMKIAMLSWETLHTIAAGGVAPHVTELAGALHANGHEVHIFTRSSNGETWENPIWGVVYHEVAFPTNPDFVREIENMCQALVSRFLHIEGALGGFDIVHGHDWLVGPAISQLQGMGRRCVFTMHSTETGRCGNVQYSGQSERIRSIEGQACHAAERVIAVSGVLKEEVCSQYGVDGRKVEVIYNGIHAGPIVEMEWQDEWTGNTKRDQGFDVMAPMFLFVGRLAVQKGPDLLLDAIPMVLQARSDARFVIVGDGHMRSTLEAEAQKRGIAHAVHFAGAVKSGSPHLKALFKSCDAVVVPSRNEPFGIVVLEAWAAGKPVIATTCGGPRDFVDPERDGYLVDPNPSSITWGICKICENFDHARWMGAQAREKALRQFNWGFIAKKAQEVYYEQLNLHGAPFCRVAGPLEGSGLAAELLGPYKEGMAVLASDPLVARGLCVLKLLRLLAFSCGADASLNWMGSEFGHAGAQDLPRPANGMNGAAVAYADAEATGMKYKHLEMFALCLNRAESVLGWLADPVQTVLAKEDEKGLLVFQRGGCVFAFNFHPTAACKGQPVALPNGGNPRELRVALDTNDGRFGGDAPANLAKKPSALRVPACTASGLVLDLQPRCGLVLAPAASAAKLCTDPWLQLEVVDEAVARYS